MRQLGVIRDKQAFSAAEVAREEYFFCGPSPGMFLFILCLSHMTSELSHGSLLTVRFRTRLLKKNILWASYMQPWTEFGSWQASHYLGNADGLVEFFLEAFAKS